MKQFRILFVVATVFTFAVAGCRSIDVQVNSYTSPDQAMPTPENGVTIGILSRTNPPEPMLDRELGTKLARLLDERGFRIAKPEEADYLLMAEAAIDSGAVGTTYRPVTAGPEYYRTYAYDRRGRLAVVGTQVAPRTYYVPESYTSYTKGLGLTLARRSLLPPPSSQPEEIDPHASKAVAWRCVASSAGPASDLRWIVNHLLLASFEYFGKDTIREQEVHIAENGKEVRELAGGRDAGNK